MQSYLRILSAAILTTSTVCFGADFYARPPVASSLPRVVVNPRLAVNPLPVAPPIIFPEPYIYTAGTFPIYDNSLYAYCDYRYQPCNEPIIVDGYEHIPYPAPPCLDDSYFDYGAWSNLWGGYAYRGYYARPLPHYRHDYYGPNYGGAYYPRGGYGYGHRYGRHW